MNFLAHAHLGSSSEQIILGNLIADSVKGSMIDSYSHEIKVGILHHREIDSFTDKHKSFLNSKEIIKSDFGRFSGVVVDIYFDHFLARSWDNYSNIELSTFTRNVYLILAKRFFILPKRVKRILPFMIAQNWLSGYANFNDLHRVFQGMNRRTNHIAGMDNAIVVLKENYSVLKNNFEEFYDDMQEFAEFSLIRLSKNRPTQDLK